MNANITCLLKACEALGLAAEVLHSSGNLVRVEIGGRSFHFANWSTPANAHSSSRICSDKDFAYTVLEGAVRMPATRSFLDPGVGEEYRPYLKFHDIDAVVAEILRNFTLPVIVKRNSGSQGSKVFLCEDEAAIPGALKSIYDKSDHRYDYIALAQQYIPGNEYRALIYREKVAFAYRKDLSQAAFTGNLSPFRWEHSRAVLIDDREVLEALEGMAQAIGRVFSLTYAGIDAIVDKDGVWWLLEINSSPALDNFIRDNGDERAVELYKTMLLDLGML